MTKCNPSSATRKPRKPRKPEKPRKDFPLFPHAAGVWAKKVRQRLHYFGPWDNPDGALACYLGRDTQASNGRHGRVSELSKVSCPTKPVKPRTDYPLYAHTSGRSAKKVWGVTRLFGSWDDPERA